MSSILDIGVAKTPKRQLNILSLEKKTVSLSGGQAEKIVLNVIEPSTGKKFNISDAWVEDRQSNGTKIAGLWFTLAGGTINKNSTLARVLDFYEAEVLGDLIGKTITALPDPRDFLVMCACDM